MTGFVDRVTMESRRSALTRAASFRRKCFVLWKPNIDVEVVRLGSDWLTQEMNFSLVPHGLFAAPRTATDVTKLRSVMCESENDSRQKRNPGERMLA